MVSLGSIIFAFYQKTRVEMAYDEIYELEKSLMKAKENEEFQRAKAEQALKEAQVQQELARQAVEEAEKQRLIALSKCK